MRNNGFIDNVLTLEAFSPNNLKKLLLDKVKQGEKKYHYLNLVINNPHVLVQPFQYPYCPIKELRSLLKYEAAELLNLSEEEIECDFQVLKEDVSKDVISGIFLCVSRNILQQYLSVMDSMKIVPLKITTAEMTNINKFFDGYKNIKGRICFLDLSKDHKVSIAVFYQQQCELFRVVHFENAAQINSEIVQSLRSVCANSNLKRVDHIYVYKNSEKEIISFQQMKMRFNVDVKPVDCFSRELPLSQEDHLLLLNLVRRFSLSLSFRHKINQIVNILCVSLFVCAFVLVVQILVQHSAVRSIRASYVEGEYQSALDLKQMMGKTNEK
jgi:hypothetical protein